MDFERYFTIHEQDLKEVDEYSNEWEHPGDAAHETSQQTGQLQIYIEDSLTSYILDLQPGRHRPQVDDNLMKPLPPVPEEPEASSMPMLGRESTSPLQRRPRVGGSRLVATDNRQTSNGCSRALKHSVSTPVMEGMSLWPKAHPCDFHKTGRTSAITLQRHIDSANDTDFESLHSQESCDLDRWANEVYGPQDIAMTSLREKRLGVTPTSPIFEHRKESMSRVTNSQPSKPYPDSAYCSSTSASSYTDHNRPISYSTSDILADYSERAESVDTGATSFFDAYDDGEEPKCASEKSHPSKKLWRKMAVSLRTARGKLSVPQRKTSGLPPIDVPMIIT